MTAEPEVVRGTVVAADFSSDHETLITVSVPTDTRWGYEAVSIVKTPEVVVAGRFKLSEGAR